MKRGEMSIGVIVALALALVVILILMTVLVNRFNLFGKGTTEVETGTDARLCAKQGSCQALLAGKSPCPGKEASVPAQGWIDCSATCCKP